MKNDWAQNKFNDREILISWDPEFLNEIRVFLEGVYDEEISEIRACLASLASLDDDVIESLVVREAEILKNKLKRLHKNSTICDKINQFIKRRFV